MQFGNAPFPRPPPPLLLLLLLIVLFFFFFSSFSSSSSCAFLSLCPHAVFPGVGAGPPYPLC